MTPLHGLQPSKVHGTGTGKNMLADSAVGFWGGEELLLSRRLNLERSASALIFELNHDRRAGLPYPPNTHCIDIPEG